MELFPRKFYVDDMFDEMFNMKSNSMKCDIYEKDGKYHIDMDLPGFDKEDIKLDCENDYITVVATKNKDENEESKNYIRRERNYETLTRRFYVGDIDKESISAEFKNGTLSIETETKKKELPEKKYIEIK